MVLADANYFIRFCAGGVLLGGYQGMLARKDRIGVPDRYHLQLAHQWSEQFYKKWRKPGKAAEIAKEPER
jgi:hypothetical protein